LEAGQYFSTYSSGGDIVREAEHAGDVHNYGLI
jgi:hypothetical protein